MEPRNKMLQKAIGEMFDKYLVKPLMNGECSMQDEELLLSVKMFLHLEKNIEETCKILNYCDPKTLKRWEDDPDLGFPKHHKNPGGKIFYWLDEVELWKKEHPEIMERVDQKKKRRD